MKTDDFIEKLSFELKPVRSIESSYKRFGRWMIVAVLCLVSGVGILGLREDWKVVLETPRLLIQNILILTAVISSSIAALLMSVPGHERKLSLKFLAVLPYGLWGILLLQASLRSSKLDPGLGFDCIIDLSIMGIMPGIFLFYLVRRGASLVRGYTGLLTLLASAGLGAWGTQFTCHSDDPTHILLWHFLPIITLGLIGIKIGRLVLRKI